MAKKILILLTLSLVVFASVAYGARIKKKEAEAQLEACNARKAAADEGIGNLEPQISALQGEISELDAKIAELTATRDSLAALPRYWGRYTVKSGDYLYKIAADPFVYHDGSKWPLIYEANNDLIMNPNLIYPGWVLFIPGVNEWKVVWGDCLWKIANSIAVYGNASRWPEIYEANRDVIEDPHWIYPGEVFVIPR
ncbi:LysM peptidoglycan-binding domain-containing protein [candidate division WOR-3 bacterium]|nr:LysM peptidoglycan-binding domain-containing protein [candidate division WOR-3 bacterium]